MNKFLKIGLSVLLIIFGATEKMGILEDKLKIHGTMIISTQLIKNQKTRLNCGAWAILRIKANRLYMFTIR